MPTGRASRLDDDGLDGGDAVWCEPCRGDPGCREPCRGGYGPPSSLGRGGPLRPVVRRTSAEGWQQLPSVEPVENAVDCPSVQAECPGGPSVAEWPVPADVALVACENEFMP